MAATAAVTLMRRVSNWAPQVMSQPFGLAGWGTVANQVACAAWRMASARWLLPRAAGGGRTRSG
jgi:hypothetical protein